MTSIPELIPRYWDYLELERMLRPATCTGYISDLRGLSKHLEHKPVEDVTRDDIKAYIRTLSASGKSSSTVRRQIHGFRGFWAWMLDEKLVNEIATRGLMLPRRRRKQPKFLSEEQLKVLISTPAATPRETLAWALFAWLGLRFNEVFKLQAKDVRLDDRALTIRESKSDDRTLPIPDALFPLLERAVAGLKPDDRLFHNWSKNKLYADFYAHLQTCGLDGLGFTFRSLRHSFVTHRLDRDVPIHVVKDLAGHKRIDTTAAYAHASAFGKRKAIENSPLAEVQ